MSKLTYKSDKVVRYSQHVTTIVIMDSNDAGKKSKVDKLIKKLTKETVKVKP